MNLLEFFFIISWIILFILSFDIAKRQRFNALHFLVFIWVGLGLLIFTFFPQFLNFIGSIFWLQRWADVLVYASIIFLLYFVILLLNKVEKNREDITTLLREIALQNSSPEIMSWEVCFLVRVYNEETMIETTLNSILNAWYKNILVVNDGSKDNSLQVLQGFNKKVKIISHVKNRWAWAALETWFEYLRRYGQVNYVCTFDIDWQHQLKDLESFLIEFRKDSQLEVVLWSRFIQKTQTNVWMIRKIILKLGIIFTFFISDIKLTDSHNWYRMFRLETIKKLRLTIDDMSYASELIDIIATKKLKFKEIPVDILYTDYSLSKWQKSFNAINIALKTIWYKFFK